MNLQQAVDSLCSTHGLPGLVAVSFGLRQMEAATAGELTSNSLFPLASVTKPFTACLLQHLFSTGVLAPDQRLCEVLPGFSLADPVAGREMTIRDALCHYSGLPPHTWAWVYGDVSRRDWILNRLPALDAVGPHREKHRYSNILYGVLGQVVEEVTGESWESALHRKILLPLGLRSVQPMDADWSQKAPVPHAMTAEGAVPIPPFVSRAGHPMAPAGELMGSVPDVALWGQSLLCSEIAGMAWEAMNTVSETRPHPALGTLRYGLGWRLDRVEGERRVWHSGQCSGYTTWMSIYPELERGLVVSTPVSGAVDLLQALDLHHVRGIAMDWARCRLRATEESPGGRVPEGEFPAGRFTHPGYGSLEIFSREGEMWSRFQCAAATPLQRSAQGEVKLALSEYGVSFPIAAPTQDQLRVPFEPQAPPIRFSRR